MTRLHVFSFYLRLSLQVQKTISCMYFPGVATVRRARRTRWSTRWRCAWEEHRRVLVGVIGGGDLSRRALVQAMVRSEEEWQAVASFCEAIMLVKEEADRIRQRQQRPRRSRRRRDPADIRPP
ncbi:hypothetical protein PYW08_011020 [Mythimna loreyi]|uniref:Uncharacterized protein n=1 Tax=Mythimna loreyi TaxID=667449 RepID=A0ACC2Q408_9NEOP|nr:hypothetical protein PYW08_011020 [Mythimna loreyi]